MVFSLANVPLPMVSRAIPNVIASGSTFDAISSTPPEPLPTNLSNSSAAAAPAAFEGVAAADDFTLDEGPPPPPKAAIADEEEEELLDLAGVDIERITGLFRSPSLQFACCPAAAARRVAATRGPRV